jgi:hypothetical protein
MNKTELNTTDDIRIISDEDLDAAVGGFQVGGGGGGGGPRPLNHDTGIGLFGIVVLAAVTLPWIL